MRQSGASRPRGCRQLPTASGRWSVRGCRRLRGGSARRAAGTPALGAARFLAWQLATTRQHTNNPTKGAMPPLCACSGAAAPACPRWGARRHARHASARPLAQGYERNALRRLSLPSLRVRVRSFARLGTAAAARHVASAKHTWEAAYVQILPAPSCLSAASRSMRNVHSAGCWVAPRPGGGGCGRRDCRRARSWRTASLAIWLPLRPWDGRPRTDGLAPSAPPWIEGGRPQPQP